MIKTVAHTIAILSHAYMQNHYSGTAEMDLEQPFSMHVPESHSSIPDAPLIQ